MNEDIKKDRSPNCPRIPLTEAIELVRKLYGKAGKSKLSPLAAVGALGYSGISGASLTTLGALTSYGLLERERGAGITVSTLAIQLLHPTDAFQERLAKVTAAMSPKVLNKLYSEGHRDTNEEVVKNHLIQEGFTPDRAKNAAAVYIANFQFANLSNDGRLQEKVEAREAELASQVIQIEGKFAGGSTLTAKPTIQSVTEKGKNVLATYSVPLGENEATITFTGTKLTPADFDGLSDYVKLFKQQYERKVKSEASVPKSPVPLPHNAMWKNKDSNRPVKIVAFLGERDGEKYFQSEDGTGIPASQLTL